MRTRNYPWTRTYSSSEWTEQLMSHSDHRMMEPSAREALFDRVVSTIERSAGVVTMEYSCLLITATKMPETNVVSSTQLC